MRTILMLVFGLSLFLLADTAQAAAKGKKKKPTEAKVENALFQKLDTNNDGQISKEEFKKLDEVLKGAKETGKKAKKAKKAKNK